MRPTASLKFAKYPSLPSFDEMTTMSRLSISNYTLPADERNHYSSRDPSRIETRYDHGGPRI